MAHCCVLSPSRIDFKLETFRCQVSLTFTAPSAEEQDNMEPNVPQQGKWLRQGKNFAGFQLLEFFLLDRRFVRDIFFAASLKAFICASSIKCDLENLGSVEIFWPLFKGGALRYLSIE